MTTKAYTVPAISCSHCKMTIERVLGATSGVDRVNVDVDNKMVDVTFDEQVLPESELVRTLTEEGYPPAAV